VCRHNAADCRVLLANRGKASITAEQFGRRTKHSLSPPDPECVFYVSTSKSIKYIIALKSAGQGAMSKAFQLVERKGFNLPVRDASLSDFDLTS
jgi:hypothetical protein